ncbi:MAG TPA: preprotein translocase subunit SecA, partial [Candidatus Hydrogenedentes bacterium]|nr:preprotein translocase subunit SecA [Candidatus Hydrogenedentota bacterium]
HESRRIDNQLRGRCGRQGDPGTTRFFLSLEDEVARLFGGDRLKRFLERFGSEQEMDDEPLSQRMVSRSIERAQRSVEEANFEARKHLKEYDDVMNLQRHVIYGMRREVLEDKDVRERIMEMFEKSIDEMVGEYAAQEDLPENWDLDGLAARFKQVFGFEPDVEGPEDGEPKPLDEDLVEQAISRYESFERAIEAEYRHSFKEQIGGDDS